MMQRWHIPYDDIEGRWTTSQILCLMAAALESNREASRQGGGDMQRVDGSQFATMMGFA